MPPKEITVSNRFIYYYANFVDRFYGYVLRRDGRNVPHEHYVGRMDESRPSSRSRRGKQTSNPAVRRRWRELRLPQLPSARERSSETVPGEIVLFLYRKRLMLGAYSHWIWGNRICIVAEDGRRLVIRRKSVVYLSGVGARDNRDFLGTYGASVRALAKHIDLREIWHAFKDDHAVIEIQDIGALYWGDDPDPSRWLALYVHLDSACPYFVRTRLNACRPLEENEVRNRRDQLAGREKSSHEREEFLFWLGRDEEVYDPETLTARQREWLEQIKRYALWGTEADPGGRTRQMLRQTAAGNRNLQQYAFERMVGKRIWDPDENLDLLRSGLALDFSADALKEADEFNLSRILKGRRRLRRAVFALRTGSDDRPELALSLRRRWRGGYELGIHVPDIAACVPAGTALDTDASDRLATLRLPDLSLTMLPPRFADDVGRFSVDRRRPALSMLWKLDRNLNIGELRIVRSAIRLRTRLSADEVERIDEGRKHSLAGTLRLLSNLADTLREERRRNGALEDFGHVHVKAGSKGIVVHHPDPTDLAARIYDEMALLAAVETGKWCVRHKIPAVFIVQDAVENRHELEEIRHPVVRRHEIRRRTPYPAYSAEPAAHCGLGVRARCAAVAPADRYVDLMTQRQIVHHLTTGATLYSAAELDPVRYRANEENAHHAKLRFRRERFMMLNLLATSAERTFPAVVLHQGRNGALVELEAIPVKTRVHAPRPVNSGDTLRLRLTGIDRWRGNPRFHVLQASPETRTGADRRTIEGDTDER
ncbi:MAG: RNB domain-containing ribonuclease [Gemmatimonadota bacterium]|nr:RNB domain-containing ribonuclease [Gemmatimonadota bacterium]